MVMSLSQSSQDKLKNCDERLQELFNKVSQFYPCQIIEGFRDKARQDEAYQKGFSKLQWPDGKHNHFPSFAVDVAPLIDGKIDWNNKEQFYHFAGFVLGIAAILGINIRWGGDWNNNLDLKDQTFFDLPHFEVNE